MGGGGGVGVGGGGVGGGGVPPAKIGAYKTERTMTEKLIAAVIAKTPLGDPPLSFNLDFHAIPFRGTKPDLENHWVPMVNRALPTVMAFVAQAAGRRVICYATANVLRAEAGFLVPKFAEPRRRVNRARVRPGCSSIRVRPPMPG